MLGCGISPLRLFGCRPMRMERKRQFLLQNRGLPFSRSDFRATRTPPYHEHGTTASTFAPPQAEDCRHQSHRTAFPDSWLGKCEVSFCALCSRENPDEVFAAIPSTRGESRRCFRGGDGDCFHFFLGCFVFLNAQRVCRMVCCPTNLMHRLSGLLWGTYSRSWTRCLPKPFLRAQTPCVAAAVSHSLLRVVRVGCRC